MEIILLENLKKLGRFGETVKVKDGFARNFLIPNKKALRATEANKSYFESRRAEMEKENNTRYEAAKKSSGGLEGKVINLIRQAGEDGRLYGSVTATDIAKAVSEGGSTEIEKNHVMIDKPVKNIGIFPVRLNPHGDLEITVNINVARSEAEAKDAAGRFARGEYSAPGVEVNQKTYEELLAEAAQKASNSKDIAEDEASDEEKAEESEKEVA